jgi:hypothetical protein
VGVILVAVSLEKSTNMFKDHFVAVFGKIMATTGYENALRFG